MKMQHSTLQLDEAALLHNFSVVKSYAPQSNVLSMIKSNAYGHGMLWAANILKASDGFGVALLSDALILRKAGIKQKIVLLRGVYTAEELNAAIECNIDIVVHDLEQVKLIQAAKPATLNIWLKVNTGMNRLGFHPNDVEAIYAILKNYSVILLTHFSCADEVENPLTQDQMAIFNRININTEKSLAHSAGILGWKESHADWVRPGLMLYGVSPFSNTTGLDFELKPVMTWQSVLIALRQQKAGDAIGYNRMYICPEDMLVGVVGVGYGLGYPRHAKNGTPILINGIETEVVGRVSMDMLMVNLKNIKNPKIGDTVTLWGNGLPIEKVAENTATSAYELLCNAPLGSA
ncbi:MAG TPA: alanine racemase [Gammaproteobacteria bacterium]|nr:alanine racemase [Gammaproteobacteria bacterium]